jgi:rhodanese-related sulfurtransferase
MFAFVLKFLLILTLMIGMCESALAGWSRKEINIEKTVVQFARDIQEGGYKVVRSDELKKWLDNNKKLLLVNTMRHSSAVIPGSIIFDFPAKKLEVMKKQDLSAFLNLLGKNKDRTIVFYCGFTKCLRSHNGAMWAVKLGYSDVYRCPGGLTAWSERDYPLEAVK